MAPVYKPKECERCGDIFTPRSSLSKDCDLCHVEVRREQKRKWKKKNPEKIREANRKHYQANAEKVLERKRKHYQANAEKIRERTRKYREANPEKVLEIRRRWEGNNKDRVKEYERKWRENNVDLKLVRQRRWREAHPDYECKYREAHPGRERKWRENNPHLYKLQDNRRRARKNSVYHADYTENEFIEQLTAQSYLDFYTDEPLFNGTIIPDITEEHIIPISKGGPDILENIVFIKSSTNSRKLATPVNKFIARLVKTGEITPEAASRKIEYLRDKLQGVVIQTWLSSSNEWFEPGAFEKLIAEHLDVAKKTSHEAKSYILSYL